MDGKELYRYAKPCNDNGITIYPDHSNRSQYKIIVNTNGREKKGEEIYFNEARVKETEVRFPTGYQKVKVLVPSVWTKIFELYKAICEKNNLTPAA